ncbi:MAG: hypothetical protein ACOCU4_09805 [Alkalispirochaeta sp.]
MDIERLSTDRLLVVLDGEQRLAVRTGIPARGFAAQRVSAAAPSGGQIVTGDRFESWPIKRLIEHEGEFYLCGPNRDGHSLAEHLSAAPLNSPGWIPGFLRACISAFQHEDVSLANITTSLVGPSGEVLFLSRDLAQEINKHLPLPQRRIAHFPYRLERPGRLDTEVYQVLAILYHALSGVPLCTEQEANASARCHSTALEKSPLHVHRPELNSTLCSLVEDGLTRSEVRTAELLPHILEVVETEGIIDTTDEQEMATRRAAAEERATRNRAGNRRQEFFRTHGRTLILATLALILVLYLPVTIIRNRLAPPATAGMGPREVAETYYEAWNELDHILMEDTLARGVARGTIREVTNVYVIDRVQTAQQWESVLMQADAWLDAGRPEGRMPYGIVDLTTQLLSQGRDTAEVRAEYEIWRPDNAEGREGATDTVAIRSRVVDRLTLSPTNHGWEISEIRTTTRSEEDVPVSLPQSD